MKRKIYFISGLGADHRVFQKINLQDFESIAVHWEIPVPGETLKSYAAKLSKQIPEKNPIIVGLSFGGIMAIEIAKQMKTEKIILISSIKTKNELPAYFKFLGQIKIPYLVPNYFFKHTNTFIYWMFGVQSDFEKKILDAIFAENSTHFLKWALNQIAHWDNQWIPHNLIHIHGDQDKIFPIKNITCNNVVKNGGHFMVLNHAVEISEMILHTLQEEK